MVSTSFIDAVKSVAFDADGSDCGAVGFECDVIEEGGVGGKGGWRSGFDVDAGGGVDADPPSALVLSGEVCGCGYGFPWSFGEASWRGLGEEDVVLELRLGSPAVLATAAGSVGELLMIGVGGPLLFPSVESETKEAPARPGSVPGDGVWAVGIDVLVAPSS